MCVCAVLQGILLSKNLFFILKISELVTVIKLPDTGGNNEQLLNLPKTATDSNNSSPIKLR